MTIGDKIQRQRKNMGYSQESFAEALGVSRQSVSKWESGASAPDIDKIIAMSELFGVSTDYLLKQDSELPEESVPQPETVEPDESDEFVDVDNPAEPTDFKKEKKKLSAKKIIALVAAVCIALTAIGIPAAFGGYREAWWALNGGRVKYTCVLVHGLGGWGEDAGINSVTSYWGSTTGNLVTYLKDAGYDVCAPCVGPISSNWDRVCELYAQLTGTRVDYGEAHSKEHNHARYGREYAEPLVENWGEKINGGQRVKVNLIGHSFGGAAVRTLAYLLAYGDEAEKNASGDETSGLFTGGKADWVYSVTALCAPHNGSSLTCVLEDIGSIAGIDNTTDLLVSLGFAVAGVAAPVNGVYDFMLDQFGIGKVNGGSADIKSVVDRLTQLGNDNAGYDLSPDGAAAINRKIKTVDGVYYFSYAYVTTKQGSILKGQVPDAGTFAVLYPTAAAMGSYTGTTDGGIVIDESWQPNDGLVSVVSAQHPTDDKWVDYDPDGKTETGIWNVMPIRKGHHGTVIGLTSDADTTNGFYITLLTMLDELKR